MAYAYDAGLIERIMPRLKQFEATTGRRIHPTMLDSLIREQLAMEGERASKERAYDLQERQIASQEQAQADAASAAKTKGLIDIGTTGLTAGLAYKAISKPSAMSELLAYQKSLGTKPQLSQGAQTAFGGGAPAIGAQTAYSGVPMANAPAYAPSATTYGVAGEMGTGLTAAPGAGTALLNAAPQIGGLYAAQYLTGKAIQPYLDEAGFSMAGKAWTYAGLPGASIGATVDVTKKGIEAIKDLGSDIGDIFGW